MLELIRTKHQLAKNRNVLLTEHYRSKTLVLLFHLKISTKSHSPFLNYFLNEGYTATYRSNPVEGDIYIRDFADQVMDVL